MLLSISSFKKKMQQGWRNCFLIMTVSVVLVVGLWEKTAIHHQMQMSPVQDDAKLWMDTREKAKYIGKNGIIVIGSSRAHLGTDIDTIESMTHRPSIQLAIDGSVFFYVLQDLADDPSITGTVIVEAAIADFFSRNQAGDKSREWLAMYHSAHNTYAFFYQQFEDWLDYLVNDFLRARALGVKPYQFGLYFIKPKEGWNEYLTTLPNRVKRADFTKADLNALFQNQLNHAKIIEEAFSGKSWQFINRVKEAATAVAKIEARGGKVIFVRYPISEIIYAYEERDYPKMIFWDHLLKSNIGVRTIHFKDYPELSHFYFPDGMHLDYRDTPKFTEALFNIINRPSTYSRIR